MTFVPLVLHPIAHRFVWESFGCAHNRKGIVADSDGQLLGLTHYLFHRSTTSVEPVCYLQDLFTIQTARGKGIGRALIHGVYEQARHAGSLRVYWHTHETNSTAMRLYDQVAERSGFIVYRKQL